MTFEEVWDRVKSVTGWQHQSQLAEFLGVKGPSINGAKRRDNFPIKWLEKIAEKYEVKIEWLLTGEGTMQHIAFKEIWARVQGITGWQNFGEMAKALKIDARTISASEQRDSFPLLWLHKISAAYNVNLNWLLAGEGPQKMDIQPSLENSPPPADLELPYAEAGGLADRAAYLSPADDEIRTKVAKIADYLYSWAAPAAQKNPSIIPWLQIEIEALRKKIQ